MFIFLCKNRIGYFYKLNKCISNSGLEENVLDNTTYYANAIKVMSALPKSVIELANKFADEGFALAWLKSTCA